MTNQTEGAAYRPFPSFRDWTSPSVDFAAVDALKNALSDLGSVPQEVRERAVQAVRNAAAIETGAIEKLYELDRGITITAALQVAQVEALLGKQEEKARGLIESQMAAYDFVLDFVTRRQALAQAWIRQLHHQLCSAQETYRVLLPDGQFGQRSLPLGTYKEEPNHVRTVAGHVHHYAPVQRTEPEMQRLVEETRSVQFEAAHPVDQASYAHYAFAAVHPFADGNGRVARAFASIFSYRAYSVPLLITADQRAEYFQALVDADNGNFLPFRSFVAARASQSIRLMLASIASAQRGSVAESIGALRRIYETRGGYLQVDIDQAAHEILNAAKVQIEKLVETHRASFAGLHLSAGDAQVTRDPRSPSHRLPLRYGPRLIRVSANSHAPADAALHLDIGVEVPKDAASDDVFVLTAGQGFPEARLPVSELLPQRQILADIQLSLFLQDVVVELVKALRQLSEASIRQKGYTV